MKALLLLLFISFSPMKNETSYNLTIAFENILEEQIGKNIYIAFWKNNTGDFPKEDKVYFGEILKIDSKDFKISKELKAGTYAFSAFIDLNGNGKLDKNLFGMPKEPFCFSNNFKPKFSAPNFEDCSFELKKNKRISLKMID